VGLFAGAGLIAFSVVAFTGVAQAEDPPGVGGRYIETLAEKLGVSVETLKTAQKEARDQMINEALAAGNLTAEQAERLRNLEPRALRDGPGRRGIGLRIAHDIIGAAAEVIGIGRDDVRESLDDGKSLAQIAEDNGVQRSALRSGLADALLADITQALANGRIDQTQADRLTDALNQNLDRIIDRTGDGERRFGPAGQMVPGRLLNPPNRN
jgi:transposase-like protein